MLMVNLKYLLDDQTIKILINSSKDPTLHNRCHFSGVLWLLTEKIPGAEDAVKSLRKIGKTFNLVSNNSTRSLKSYLSLLNSKGFNILPDDLTTPVSAILDYFKKIHFSKEIYVIGTKSFKEEFRNNGFKLAEDTVSVSFKQIDRRKKIRIIYLDTYF